MAAGAPPLHVPQTSGRLKCTAITKAMCLSFTTFISRLHAPRHGHAAASRTLNAIVTNVYSPVKT